MYKIKNITNGKVILGDLSNLILSKDEEVDLDARFSRDIISASQDLEKALKPDRRILAVLHKDVHINVSTPAQVSPSLIEEMVRKTLSQLGVGDKKDLTHDKLDAILAAMTNTRPQARMEESPAAKSNDHLDNDTSVDIQSRLIKRLSNNVEANVEAKIETKESTDLKKNADDLSNLLNGDM